MSDELSLDELIAAEEAAAELNETSLEDETTSTDLVPVEGELVAGEAVSLEEVLDTIFNILYTHSAQIAAIGEHVFAERSEAPEIPKLTIVGNVDAEG